MGRSRHTEGLYKVLMGTCSRMLPRGQITTRGLWRVVGYPPWQRQLLGSNVLSFSTASWISTDGGLTSQRKTARGKLLKSKLSPNAAEPWTVVSPTTLPSPVPSVEKHPSLSAGHWWRSGGAWSEAVLSPLLKNMHFCFEKRSLEDLWRDAAVSSNGVLSLIDVGDGSFA